MKVLHIFLPAVEICLNQEILLRNEMRATRNPLH